MDTNPPVPAQARNAVAAMKTMEQAREEHTALYIRDEEKRMTELPAGYMKDSQGRLVPVESIKQIDLERNQLVLELASNAEKLAKLISTFKVKCLGDIGSFVELSAEQYGIKTRGDGNTVTLMSFDGSIKIQRSVEESVGFDERLQAAKALVDECIRDWSSDSRFELKTIISDTFQVDKRGRINTQRILSLRKLNIEDERWQRAMHAIGESLVVTNSKAYVRFYFRQPDGSYKHMPLDLAA